MQRQDVEVAWVSCSLPSKGRGDHSGTRWATRYSKPSSTLRRPSGPGRTRSGGHDSRRAGRVPPAIHGRLQARRRVEPALRSTFVTTPGPVSARNGDQDYPMSPKAQPPPRPRLRGQRVVFYRKIPVGRAKEGEKAEQNRIKTLAMKNNPRKNAVSVPPSTDRFLTSAVFDGRGNPRRSRGLRDCGSSCGAL